MNTIFIFLLLFLGCSAHSFSLDECARYEQDGNIVKALSCAKELPPLRMHSLEEKLLKNGSTKILFDEHQQPLPRLIKLLQLVGMPPLNTQESAINQINAWAQSHLLRQGERWHTQDNQFEKLKSQIKPLLKDLGFIEETVPHFKTYRGALVHGALFPVMRLRLHYLIEQWKKGVRFSSLYFLSGERPLEPQKENPAVFVQDEDSPLKIRKGWQKPVLFPKTEQEMAQMVWDQADIPEGMRQTVSVHFVNAPMTKNMQTDQWVRPTTEDTVRAWLQMKPAYGKYLAISNAPYTNRQDILIRSLAPKEYTFETIGFGASEQLKMAIFLDELARCIYTELRFSL